MLSCTYIRGLKLPKVLLESLFAANLSTFFVCSGAEKYRCLSWMSTVFLILVMAFFT